MAELDPRTSEPDDKGTQGPEPSTRRRPRRKAGAPAGAPVVEAPAPTSSQPSTLAALTSETASVVTDAKPLNLRAKRRAARAAAAENTAESNTAPRREVADSAPATQAGSVEQSASGDRAHAEPEVQAADAIDATDAADVKSMTPERDSSVPDSGQVKSSSETSDDESESPIAEDLQALAQARKSDPNAKAEPSKPAIMDTQEFASLLFRAPVQDEQQSDDDEAEADAEFTDVATFVSFDAPDLDAARERSSRRSRKRSADTTDSAESDAEPASGSNDESTAEKDHADDSRDEKEGRSSRRRRRGGRGRRGRGRSEEETPESAAESYSESGSSESGSAADDSDDDKQNSSTRRRRRRRRNAGSGSEDQHTDDPPNTVVRVREGRDEVKAVKGSTRLEAKRQRRKEGRESGRRRHSITESEFLARRESVKRSMIVRERPGRTQIVVLEDNILVEHYVAQKSQTSMVGNVYLGKVQNVLPSMEAAFVDIGKGRNAVLYAGEVNWDAVGLDGQPRRIELALKSGDPVLVQVTKDPIGHKGARLTSQISLPGRYLVYVPGGSMTGISRKLPDNERSRLKKILKAVVPEDAGVIVRTAAEGASEEELTRDVERLQRQWEKITKASKSKGAPAPLSTEPDLAIKVVRDIFNEDFTSLIVEGESVYKELHEYISEVAPDLLERVTKHVGQKDSFAKYRIDEQLMKAMDRKVYLPSGGSLVIDRTEAMTVVDVNTGKFTGSGGSLEETVTRNNLEAAEEIVRQLRLRDIGGIIVVDFIDMVLESNRDLVLRRMIECLSRDRTKHQVAEVTSLGLVQMTRKRVGAGLVETFSSTCEHCNGRGIHIDLDGQVHVEAPAFDDEPPRGKSRRRSKRNAKSDHSQQQGITARESGNDSSSKPADSSETKPEEKESSAAARNAVQELVDTKNSADVHRLEEDEQSRALAAATIASIAAASSSDTPPEVTVDGQVISTTDAEAEVPGGAVKESESSETE